MYILGISAYYHDSAAVLVKDGKVVCGIEEERFSRVKHDNSFPYRAIQFCLHEAKVSIHEIETVAYYEKPLLKLERILDTFVATWPRALIPFLRGMPEWLDSKIKIEHTLRTKVGFKGKIAFVPHHLSHAAAAYYPSPYESAAILTIDGVGEYLTTGLWIGKGCSVSPLSHIGFPHSVGLLYSTFTAFLGFKVNEDEFKVMGLAAYGKPRFVNKIRKIVDVRQDGSFKLDLDYFSFREGYRMWSNKFERLFGKPRKTAAPLTQVHRDIAASIQAMTEEIYFKILNHLHALTGQESVCISGGVALNALANGKIYRRTPFKRVFILGTAGDSGAALGAALYVFHTKVPKRAPISGLAMGSHHLDNAIKQDLDRYQLRYKKLDEAELIRRAVDHLAEGKIVGWFQGKAELGPRALGNHSILCRTGPRSMKTKMNVIKRREQFRPFAGSILQEHVHEYFEVPEPNHWSPFMVFCFPVRKEKRRELAAVVHADNTCRIQTVSRENGRYYRLIKEYYRKTGSACILNTSFNLQGEPIVESPRQAIEDFLKTKIDCLVIEKYLVEKNLQH